MVAEVIGVGDVRQILTTLEQQSKSLGHFLASQIGADAMVNARTKSHMGTGVMAHDIQGIGVFIFGRVAVGGRKTHHHACSLWHLYPAYLGIGLDHPKQTLHRRFKAQYFVGKHHAAGRIFAQQGLLRRVINQECDAGGNSIGSGFIAGHQKLLRQRDHLGHGKPLACLVMCVHQMAKQIFAWTALSGFKLGDEMVLEFLDGSCADNEAFVADHHAQWFDRSIRPLLDFGCELSIKAKQVTVTRATVQLREVTDAEPAIATVKKCIEEKALTITQTAEENDVEAYDINLSYSL